MKAALSLGLLSRMVWAVWLAAAESSAFSAEPDAKPAAISKEDGEFFEKSIRPILVEKCYSCHSSSAKTLRGELYLDSRAGVQAGGEGGKILDGRDPEKSRLIQGVRGTDPNFQMPPNEKLSAT